MLQLSSIAAAYNGFYHLHPDSYNFMTMNYRYEQHDSMLCEQVCETEICWNG